MSTTLDKTVDESWVKDKLLNHYSVGVERKLYRSIHKDNYETIGSVYYSLEGSPPKGYAIYRLGTGGVTGVLWLYDRRGKRYKIYEKVKIKEIQEK